MNKTEELISVLESQIYTDLLSLLMDEYNNNSYEQDSIEDAFKLFIQKNLVDRETLLAKVEDLVDDAVDTTIYQNEIVWKEDFDKETDDIEDIVEENNLEIRVLDQVRRFIQSIE